MATYPDRSEIPRGSLLQVFPSRLSQDDISADIIAIHGLGTTSPKTWEAIGKRACDAQRPRINWLSDDDMLPHVVPSANIFTFTWNSDYYKNAPLIRIQDVAGVLLSQLQSQRDKALEIANIKGSEYGKLVVATSGVIFLGSPLQGTRAGTAAQWRAMLAGVLNQSPSKTLLQDLNGSTKALRDTSERFVKMIAAPPMQTMTKCFWESKPSQLANAILPAWMTTSWTQTNMILIGNDAAQLVEEDSACFLNLPKEPLDAAHVMMNKFLGPNDANFELVSSTIKEMVGKAKKITLAQREVFRFWGVFWLDASSENSLNRGFVDIAEKCDLYEKSFKGARSWLQETSHSWLLILDNADDPTLDYSLYLPTASKGHVLITSRIPRCANLQTAGKDHYESLSEETAVELLFKASQTDLSLYSTHDVESRNIVKLLGRHALAIVLAGASISEGICDLGDYAKTFKERRQRMFEISPNLERSRYGNVYATFEVSATYLSNRRDQTATDALELLSCYAFMNFTNFPETAFEEAWRNSRKLWRDVEPNKQEHIEDLSPWHRSHLPTFMRHGSSQDLDTISLRETQALLASLSIIVLDLPAHTTRMHPVTHMWARDRLEKQNNCTSTWLGALAVLCCSIKHPYKQEALWVQLQPHIELVKKSQPSNYLYHNKFRLHQSFFRLSWVLHTLRADKAVIEMLQTCLLEADQSWTEFTYGEEIGHLYGRCLNNCGDVKKAIKTLEHVVKIRGKLPKDHPSRLVSQHELAAAYNANGQVEEAIKLLEHIIEIQKEKMVEDHPFRLASQHVLAIAYNANGQVDKAIKLLEHVVKIHKKLAEDHPDRLASQHELAGAYNANGQLEKAIQLLEHVVKVHKKLAEDHPSRLDSQHELARAYNTNGQVEKAIQLLEHVVKVEEKLAEDHSNRLVSQQTLAVAYGANGQINEAIQLLEHVVKVQEKLAEDHPSRLISQRVLARIYRENGQADKALEVESRLTPKTKP
ncbi:MAG: hypothetical protein Q9161_008470 [Pseudevernia consocians]